jgi:hypothetical protein
MLEMKLDTDMFKRDARKAHLTHEKALPEAVRYTLNELAVKTYQKTRRDLKKTFTIRNTWTARNMAFEKVPTSQTNIDFMESHAGSRLKYMEEQQEGVQQAAKGRHGVPLPTTVASNEGQSQKRRKKVIRRNYLNRLRVAKGLYRKASRLARRPSQVLSIVTALARKQRKKVVFFKASSGKKGLFLIDGDRLPMLYDLSEKRVVSKPRPWLTDATDAVSPMVHKLYGKALYFNLRKYSN